MAVVSGNFHKSSDDKFSKFFTNFNSSDDVKRAHMFNLSLAHALAKLCWGVVKQTLNQALEKTPLSAAYYNLFFTLSMLHKRKLCQ